MHAYISWIPNVLGKLSFTSVSNSKYVDDYRVIRNENGVTVLVTGKYIFSDHLFPRVQSWFPNLKSFFRRIGINIKVRPEVGYVRFCVLARARGRWDDLTKLKGVVYYYPDRFGIPNICAKNFYRMISFYFEKIDSGGHVEVDDFEKAIMDFFRSNTDVCKNNLIFCSRFNLYRSGKILLSFQSMLIDERESLIRAKMFFNIIRECFHVHKHHNPKDDNIVSVYKIYPQTDSKEWRKWIQYSMLRHMIRSHGSWSDEEYMKGMGVAAYLKTYNKIFLCDSVRKYSLEKECRGLDAPEINNFLESIMSRYNVVSLKSNKISNVLLVFLSTIMAINSFKALDVSVNLNESVFISLFVVLVYMGYAFPFYDRVFGLAKTIFSRILLILFVLLLLLGLYGLTKIF